MKKLVFILLAATLWVSCETQTATTVNTEKVGKSQASITNTKWVLAERVKGNQPTLHIENDRINGNAGCNNYFGGVEIDAASGKFIPSKMGSTRMACKEMSAESNYLSALGNVNKYVVNGNQLELYKDGLVMLKFTKAE